MKSPKTILLLFFCLLNLAFTGLNAQNSGEKPKKIGLFTGFNDIGKPGIAGTAKFDKASDKYLLSGSGVNIWFKEDSFSFLWKEIKGDFVMQTTVKFVGEGKYHRKIGIMVRKSLEAGSATACCAIHGDGLTSFQYRPTDSATMLEKKFKINGTEAKLILEKKGNNYTMETIHSDGTREKQAIEVDLGSSVLTGLFICSHNNEKFEQAEFTEVKISKK